MPAKHPAPLHTLLSSIGEDQFNHHYYFRLQWRRDEQARIRHHISKGETRNDAVEIVGRLFMDSDLALLREYPTEIDINPSEVNPLDITDLAASDWCAVSTL